MDISHLRISISGIRGHSPEYLDSATAYAFTRAYCDTLKGDDVVVARDSRPSGNMLKRAVIQALIDGGKNILDADLVPLPTLQVAVEESRAAGGIDITASHNPVEYNGLKFLNNDGIFIDQNTLDHIIATAPQYYTDDITYTSETSPRDINKEAMDWHLRRVEPLIEHGESFTVAVDATNGAGSVIVPQFLRMMGCDVIELANDPTQPFPHIPEPTPKNLEWTQRELEDKEYDLCVVVDPDSDRLVLIDEKGNLLSEEFTLPLIARELVAMGREGVFVVNQSTSQATDRVVEGSAITVHRAKVGEVNVVHTMQDLDAVFGGEGNGGVIDPSVHYGRDPLVGMTYIINLLRRTKKDLSVLVDELPQLVIKKDTIPLSRDIDDRETFYAALSGLFPETEIDTTDGVRFLFSDGAWIHLRPSNTEPIFRVIGEGDTSKHVDTLIHKAKEAVEQLLS